MAKIKIAVAGCLGRMGQELSKQIINNNKLEFVGGFEHEKHKDVNKQFKQVSDINSTKIIVSNPTNLIKTANVIIDFTTPQSTLENIKIASQNKTAVIIGTTGMTESQKKKVKSYAKKIPILMSSNMSIGVNLLFNLVQQTACSLKDTDYDIEIAETHHKHKKDAPSGTALSLGEYAAVGRKTSLNKSKVLDRTKKLTNRKKGDIGFSVTRGGEIAGEHTVSFIGENDRVDLVHKANNRTIFVKGAIDAAIFINKKKSGLYSMNDLLLSQ
ncbi:4-hydroxy-tetrahydrodipicolinate reductase [Pelagibacteraceae bacterium]|nr:4-hydroxy-tetrahydrodipicolinate reductase [Pelagibacteraceae bacterium]